MKKVYISATGKKEDAEKTRARMRKYNKSKHGKEIREKYRERNKKRIREYMREYFRKRRELGRKKGLCGNCLKRNRLPGITFCKVCRDVVRKNSLKQKKNNYGGAEMQQKEKKKRYVNNFTQKEKEAAELWEAIKKSEAKRPKEDIDINTAIKHLKEVLQDEKDNR